MTDVGLTQAQREEIDALIAQRLEESNRALRRTLTSAVLRRASDTVRTIEIMPCRVISVGVVVGGVLRNNLATVLADDAQDGRTTIATRVAGPVAGDRGMLMFVPPSGILVFPLDAV